MGSRYVSIWFPELLTDWHCIDDPSLKNIPFAIRMSSHGRMIVLAASEAARKAGIRQGMVVADARALCPELLLIDEKKELNERLLHKLALWAIRFTPVTSIDLPGGLLLDVSGCSHLWGGDESYLQDIFHRLKDRGYHVRIAMADTIGAAWAFAHYGQEQQVLLPGEHLSAALSLPVTGLRLEQEIIDKLFKLGLRTIGHLAGIPAASLNRRFGLTVTTRLNQLMGREPELLQAVRPVEPFSERLYAHEPITTATGTRIALETLLTGLCTKLRNEGKGLRSALFKTYQLSGGVAQIAIETSGATTQVAHLLKLFDIRLPLLQAKEGIELFILEAKHVEAISHMQECIWETPAGIHDAQVHELLDRIATKVGKENIKRFLPAEHYLPERAFRIASGAEEQATLWKTDKPRPLFFLEPPETIEVTAPIPDYPPMLFRYRGKLHKIVKADGPERMEQEWWVKDGEHRDYYYVEDEAGKRYWLFRLGHYNEGPTPQWFIHGFFP